MPKTEINIFIYIFTLSIAIAFILPKESLCIETHSAMYDDRAYEIEKYIFSPRDTLFLVTDIFDLKPGDYVVIAEWITPWGDTENQTIHEFSLSKAKKEYRVLSWLELWKNDFLERIVKGSEYDLKIYGVWKVRLYLNGMKIVTKTFKIV